MNGMQLKHMRVSSHEMKLNQNRLLKDKGLNKKNPSNYFNYAIIVLLFMNSPHRKKAMNYWEMAANNAFCAQEQPNNNNNIPYLYLFSKNVTAINKGPVKTKN